MSQPGPRRVTLEDAIHVYETEYEHLHGQAPFDSLRGELANLRECQRILDKYLDEDRILYPTYEGETITDLRGRAGGDE